MPNNVNPAPQFPLPHNNRRLRWAHKFGNSMKSVVIAAFWLIVGTLALAVTIIALLSIYWAAKMIIHALNGF